MRNYPNEYQGPLPGTTEWKEQFENPVALAALTRSAAFAMGFGAGLILNGSTEEEEDEQDAPTKTSQNR